MLKEKALHRLTPLAAGLFEKHNSNSAMELPSSAQAAVALARAVSASEAVLWLTDGPQSMETAHRDITTLQQVFGGKTAPVPVLYLPPADTDQDTVGYHLSALLELDKLPDGKPTVIVTSAQSLMQTTISSLALANRATSVSVGDTLDPHEMARTMADNGYAFTAQVTEKSTASLRGGILDAWPPTELWPVRIEFFGEEIDSIRTFDPATQASREQVNSVLIPPSQLTSGQKEINDASPLDYMPEHLTVIWSDANAIEDHAALREELAESSEQATALIPFPEVSARLKTRDATSHLFIGPDTSDEYPSWDTDIQAAPSVFNMPRGVLQPDVMERTRHKLVDDLSQRARKGQQVLLFFNTQGGLDHFRNLCRKESRRIPRSLERCVGVMSSGFLSEASGIAVISESDLYGVNKQALSRYYPKGRSSHPDTMGLRITSIADLEPGDLAVHVQHGIGRYMGLYEIVVAGKRQEVITLEYAEGAKLHVPVSQAHLLSRYVGLSGNSARLHHLGKKRWSKERAKAEKAVADFAASLLQTQAKRNALEGFAFPHHVPWQTEFAASFPYRETPDQHTVAAAVTEDMLSTRPMDRLVCGDAGYGKTEIAMRAAFTAVMSGKQVAVLVPTTVLAQQHFETFSERMASYPVHIAMLSRFCTGSEKKATLAGLKKGTVDIVIGTHALLQPHVHFSDLGLVVVDEEQRFGVRHKEELKQIRTLVDVLTMTATPIPRTLYMSMVGARDMSLMRTPPRERMAIHTVVAKNTDKVVREAVLRELNREGQVFYLHNRILTINKIHRRLSKLIPEARIQIAHGRMPSGELARVMHDFSEGRFDVLLSTTIIESGLDIPRANTILIDRADRFGIADLYQLRGRVGRSNRKAYAYLLLPQDGVLDSDARLRLSAIRKHSGLSSGFNLALRDLEIRGAGNLLGREQSGHIAAIGFDLYCQLLKRTVAHLTGKDMPPIVDVELKLDFIDLSPASIDTDRLAAIPYDYVEDEGVRISTYRQLAEVVSRDDVHKVRASLRDRFGPIPPPVERLLCIAELRIRAAAGNIRKIETKGRQLLITGPNDYVMNEGRFPRLKSTMPDEKLKEIQGYLRS